MENKAGEKFSIKKNGEKFLRGYIGAGIAFFILYLFRGKVMPAEADIAHLQNMLLGLLPLLAGLYESVMNLIKFLRKKGEE